jgi:hypothetical protein
MATITVNGVVVAVAGSNTYDGTGAWNIVNYNNTAGPIVVNFTKGTVTKPGGSVDTLDNIDGIVGPSSGGATVFSSATNPYGGVAFAPDGGSNTFVGNNIPDSHDILQYINSPTGIYGDLAAGFVLNGWGGKDTIIGSISGFEGGSNFNDILFGDASGHNVFEPVASDYIDGGPTGTGSLLFGELDPPRGAYVNLGEGYDYNGYGGHDELLNINAVQGTVNDNVLIGNTNGNTWFQAGPGNNIIIGQGSGNSIGWSSDGAFVDLSQGFDYHGTSNTGMTSQSSGESPGVDTLTDIQSVVCPPYSDILVANNQNDTFSFQSGGDTSSHSYVFSGSGDDTIVGAVGGGQVTVVYSGPSSSYSWEIGSSGWITINKPNGSHDYALDISSLQFSNGIYNLATDQLQPVPDETTGTGDDDALFGTSSNTVFHPGTGNDLIYGNGGTNDTVVLPGTSSQYTVQAYADVVTVVGPNVDDTLIDVTQIQFGDGTFHTLSLGTSDNTINLGDGLCAVYGGGGINTVVADGSSSQYTITTNGTSATIADKTANRDGTVNLTNVQLVQFTDKTVDIFNPTNTVINDLSSTATSLTVSTQNASIYLSPSITSVTAAGNDTTYLAGTDGSNVSINGGAGTNTVVFSGIAAQYTFNATQNGLTVTGPDGTDQLSNIQFLQFSDQKVEVFSSVAQALAAFVSNQAPSYNWGIVYDTAANIDANLDKLETLASNYANNQLAPYISAIYITNSGTPSLSMTDTQSMNDQTAINLIQTPFELTIQGTSGNTTLQGQLGPFQTLGDTLIAGTGVEHIYGGFGTDTVVFSGPSSEYTISVSPQVGIQTVAGPRDLIVTGPNITATLSYVEYAQFSDKTINLVDYMTSMLPTPQTIQNDYFGITQTSLSLTAATTEANAINAGTTTETQYVDSLLSQVANTTIPAVAVEASMYGVTGTSAEITSLVTNYLPAQVQNAIVNGYNPQIYACEALGVVFAFGNENGSAAFANNYGPSNAAMPNTTAGDASFAAAAASLIFGSAETSNTVPAIEQWVSNWKAFYTAHGIAGVSSNPTPQQIDLAARGAAWGDAIGLALFDNLGPFPGQITNFLEDAAHGTAIYSASLLSQPTAAPFQGAATASVATTASDVQVTGVAASVDHAVM